jgi:predicted acylesterase/phospholipase RssA
MCGCTLYDSPTCGHSWISMSQPCGFLSDLLSCPKRQTYQTLVAPPFTCPQCNGGFADRETIEMVQGPWGCNQLIRSHIGGSYAIPGSWGNVPLAMNNWVDGPGLGMSPNMPLVSSRAMVPVNSHVYDHRLTVPYGSHPTVCSGYSSFSNGMIMDDGFIDDYGYVCEGRKRRKYKSSSRHVYRHSSKPATNCTVM